VARGKVDVDAIELDAERGHVDAVHVRVDGKRDRVDAIRGDLAVGDIQVPAAYVQVAADRVELDA